MNRMAWIFRAALELVLGAVLFVLAIVWRYPYSHLGVWLGLQNGGPFGWVPTHHAARLYAAATQDALLLVAALLTGSGVFVYWELARSKQQRKLGLVAYRAPILDGPQAECSNSSGGLFGSLFRAKVACFQQARLCFCYKIK